MCVYHVVAFEEAYFSMNYSQTPPRFRKAQQFFFGLLNISHIKSKQYTALTTE